MHITTIKDVRSGDVVRLECLGSYTYHVVVVNEAGGEIGKGYKLKQITQEEYLKLMAE